MSAFHPTPLKRKAKTLGEPEDPTPKKVQMTLAAGGFKRFVQTKSGKEVQVADLDASAEHRY